MIFLAFVVPLAVYCLVLSVINHRRHPVIVSGAWDFAGVLFASSGILLVGGPAILTGFYEHWRLSWLLGQTRYLQGIGENWSFWISLWLLYFALVAGGAAVLLRQRRGLTSVYNVEPAVFADVLLQVLDGLGVEWLRYGRHRFLLRFREPPFEGGSEVLDSFLLPKRAPLAASPALAKAAPSCSQQSAVTAPSSFTNPWTELALETFPAMRHVTLHWRGRDETLRLEVETELAKRLAQMRTRSNPVGAWFLSLALGLFFSALFVLCALLVMRVLQLPR